MTLVTVVTPSFNQATYLEQTICSVLEQDYPEVEYLLIDGGSTDGSLDIIRKYANRFTWWVSEKDNGQADAINKGLFRARGEIIAWLNSDDYYLPGTIRSAVEAFAAHPQAALIYGNMLAVDEHGNVINHLRYRPVRLEDLLCFEIIGQPAVFMRRSAFEKTGGLDPSYHFLLDHLLWIHLAQQGDIIHVNQTWAAARYHPAAKNRARAAEFGAEAFRMLEWAQTQPALQPILQELKTRPLASAYRLESRYRLDAGQNLAALIAWFHALRLHPATALRRLNLPVSALLNLLGLRPFRELILGLRRVKYRRLENPSK